MDGVSHPFILKGSEGKDNALDYSLLKSETFGLEGDPRLGIDSVDLVSKRAIEPSPNWICRQDILSTDQVIDAR
jgi:hypothetical protein